MTILERPEGIHLDCVVVAIVMRQARSARLLPAASLGHSPGTVVAFMLLAVSNCHQQRRRT
jgi:hypothetical protein